MAGGKVKKLLSIIAILLVPGVCGAATRESFPLSPPKGSGPVVVRADFELRNINGINDEAETFEFAGILTMRWQDERQAFDPADAGVDEKVYQGAYQVDEVFTGWFPQVVLANDSGLYEKRGAVLRVRPDGTLTLIEKLNAAASVDLDLRRFPLDRQRLEAVFEILGFDEDQVTLRTGSSAGPAVGGIRLPQWAVQGVTISARSRPASERPGAASQIVVGVDVRRQSFFITRLVIIPLILIVLLSFSVFWMDRSSLGDRISVSFIGILTGVAYQIVMSDILPRISYMTLMNGILSLSFLTMCATVVVNLAVGALDRKGRSDVGDRVDRRCRWIFPLAYFGLMLFCLVAAFVFF